MDRETEEQQENRIKLLWKQLNVDGQSRLDSQGLKHGLRSIGHPLAQADTLIQKLLQAADINHDGGISYNDFRQFVGATESHLQKLFQNIDRNHDGRLNINELRDAFLHAGITVPDVKLKRFFHDVDKDHDGSICFSEWRDFLLFLPPSSGLRDVMSVYQTAVRLGAEGDSQLHDEAIQGLGINSPSYAYEMFGLVPYIFTSITRPNPSQNSYTAQLDDRLSRPLPVLKPPDVAQQREVSHLTLSSHLPATQKSRSLRKVLTALLPDPGYFLAGGLSGVTSRTLTAPLDRLKVKLIAQTDSVSAVTEAARRGSPLAAGKHGASILIRAMRDLWAAGGIRSLFAGNGINVVKVMPESAVKFGSYEAAKRIISQLEGHNDPKRISQASQFVAGGVAGMISQAFTYPLDTLKFRMQNETVKGGLRGNALIAETARKMWTNGGMRPFYKGLTMGMIGMFPYAAIDLGTFEFFKRKLIAHNIAKNGGDTNTRPNNFTLALIGGFSGAFGASVVYPLNLLRTRLQCQGTVSHPRTYTGMVDVARQTVHGEGYRGLFKGLTPNLLKVIPAVSITYVVYENAKRALDLR